MAGLPSTQLEIATLAFSALSMITYLLYWNRPQGVETVHVVKSERIPCADFDLTARQGPAYLWRYCRSESNFNETLGPVPIPNDASYDVVVPLPDKLRDVLGRNEEIALLAFGAVVGGRFSVEFTALLGTSIFQHQVNGLLGEFAWF